MAWSKDDRTTILNYQRIANVPFQGGWWWKEILKTILGKVFGLMPAKN